MAWFRRRSRNEPAAWWDRRPERDDDSEPDRSLLEIEDDLEMRLAQAEVDAEPLTPGGPRPQDRHSAT